jgi:2-amino-4-hydroxy-6-hydroxymethyldihydropteridine diphosphokinase
VKRQDILENQAKIVYLGIGSNLGDRKKNIEISKFHLSEKKLDFLSISSFYETPSWPDPKKPRFLNIVIKAKFYHDPESLLEICKNIEILLGREKGKKNDPRVCDIDIIDFNKKILKIKNKLTLPHKLMHKRNFVLIPFFEIQKKWHHPIIKKDIKSLISLLPQADIRSIKQI